MSGSVARYGESAAILQPLPSTTPAAPAGQDKATARRASLSAALCGALKAEESTRHRVSSAVNSRRLRGVYSVVSPDTVAATESLERETESLQSVARVTSNPWGGARAPPAGRTKRKTALVVAPSGQAGDAAHRDPLAVSAAATFIDGLLDSGGFAQVVFRVKEHLRRGDNSIGPDEEEAFYKIVSFCLRYYRLRVEYEGSMEGTVERREGDGSGGWVPRLQPIMQCLDRLSFHRVCSAMRSLIEGKKHEQVTPLIGTYIEMLSYLHVLLGSTDTCHHELAAAALFALFYRSADRLDPLPLLLREWRPTLHDTAHTSLLVELLHTTMKVLDKARDVFSMHEENMDPGRKDKKKKKGSKGLEDVSDKYEVAVQQYITSVLCFDCNEYFRRLVSNQSVRMYARMLELFRSNTPKTNHYIFVFIRLAAWFTSKSMYQQEHSSHRISLWGLVAEVYQERTSLHWATCCST